MNNDPGEWKGKTQVCDGRKLDKLMRVVKSPSTSHTGCHCFFFFPYDWGSVRKCCSVEAGSSGSKDFLLWFTHLPGSWWCNLNPQFICCCYQRFSGGDWDQRRASGLRWGVESHDRPCGFMRRGRHTKSACWMMPSHPVVVQQEDPSQKLSRCWQHAIRFTQNDMKQAFSL